MLSECCGTLGKSVPSFYFILPLLKLTLRMFGIHWIRLKPKMNTTITIFNTSKPYYWLKAKVIERNIYLTQTQKSITFNELREKE